MLLPRLLVGRQRTIHEGVNGAFHDKAHTAHCSARMFQSHLLEKMSAARMGPFEELIHGGIGSLKINLLNLVSLGVEVRHEDRVLVIQRI